MITRDISNRIKLCIIEDKTFKSDFFAVDLIVPLTKETVTENVLLASVLSRGTKSCESLAAMNRALYELYGATLSSGALKKGDSLVLSFSISYLKDRFTLTGKDNGRKAAALLFETITSPAFKDGLFRRDYVESEIKNLRDDIAAEINDKRRYVLKRCTEETLAGEPFGLSAVGYAEDLDKITPESLVKRYNAVLAEAKIFAFAFGEADETAMTESLLEAFNKDAPFYEPFTVSGKKPEKPVFLRESMAVKQAKLAIGFRADPLDEFGQAELNLFNFVYGASPVSKLFMNVREKQSLCYYCASVLYGKKGFMIVDCGIDAANYEKAYDEILRQLSDVRDRLITEDEMKAAKKALKNAYKSLSDSAAAVHNWYLGCFVAGTSDTLEELYGAVDGVEADRVADIASRFAPKTVFLLEPSVS